MSTGHGGDDMRTRGFTAFGPGGDDDGEGGVSPDDVERWHRRRQPPDNEVPVDVPLTVVLARTEQLAVVLTSVQACSTGFGFEVCVRLRQSPPPGVDVYGQFMSSAGTGGTFLLGVELADGRRGSLLDGFGWPPGPGLQGAGQDVSLSGLGGGGGGRRLDHRWWVSPLPPPGPLLVVVRWDAQDVPETVTELDGGAIAAAGASAEVLWPWEPERPEEHEPEESARPTSGWFAGP